MSRLPLPLMLCLLVLVCLVAAPVANAELYGLESNGEFVNSNVTRDSQASALDKARSQGATVVRANFGWNEIATAACATQTVEQLRDPDNACYDWRVPDGLVQEGATRGVQVLASVTRVPTWLHGRSQPYWVGATGTQWARTVQHYSAFVRAMATRYTTGSVHGTIRLWTVWSEPNSALFWQPMNTSALLAAAPRRYAQLAGATAVAIKAANPSALVAVGPTGPISTIRPQTYIKVVQQWLPAFLPGTGAVERRYIAAWAHNPYPGYNVSPSRATIKPPAIGMGNIRDLFATLDGAAITRGLPVWATEFAWETNPPDRTFGIPVATQGRYLGEAFDWLESTNRVPVMIWYGLTDPTDVNDWQGGTWYASGVAKASRLWWQRPVSLPISATRRGSFVRVWGRSMIKPSATRIAYSYDGRSWRLASSGVARQADGTSVLRMRVYRTTWFATWDGVRGPARVVSVR